MNEYLEFLKLAKKAAKSAMQLLLKAQSNLKDCEFDLKFPKEMKSKVDYELNEEIFNVLKPTKIPILSEEAVNNFIDTEKGLYWVVDPLDGTVNFVRELGSCSISIALFFDNRPIFGVIIEYPHQILYWGGKNYGAFANDNKITVSKIKEADKAIVCSGFPSRFSFSEKSKFDIFETFNKVSKVRMLGTASLSLIQVAKGSAELYFENDIDRKSVV